MQYYYEIEEAWKLYVEQGVVKAESLNPSLLRMWELSKIGGADYAKNSINLSPQPNFKSKLNFSIDLVHYANKNNLTLILVDADLYIHDVCGKSLSNMILGAGCNLQLKDVGYTSLHLSIEKGGPASLNYSENFIRCLHDYETTSHPIQTKEANYYILALSEKAGLNERLGKEYRRHIEELLKPCVAEYNLSQYKIRDFIHLFDLSIDAIIIKRLTNTELNKFFDEGMKLDEHYTLLNMEDILQGKKQLIALKEDKNMEFLLSPIKWKSESSILCQAEELESSYRPFFSIEGDTKNKLYYDDIPTDLSRRLSALSLGAYPVYIFYHKLRELSFIIPLIETYYKEESRILYYSKNKDLIGDLCVETKVKRQFYPHDLNTIIYHIVIDEIDKNEIEELSHTLLESISKRTSKYKVVFYIEKKPALELLKTLSSENSLVDLQSLDFSTTEKIKYIEEYYAVNTTNNSKNTSLRGDLLAMEDDMDVKQYYQNAEEDPSQNQIYQKPILTLKDAEKIALLDALAASSYNISEASKKLGIARASLYRKMKENGIKVEK